MSETTKSKKTVKNLGGRPEEWNDDVVKKLEEVFSIDGSIQEACFYADISRQTYYNHVKQDAPKGSEEKRLFDRFEKLREKPILAARQRVVQGVKESYQNAMDYLKRKRKNEFGDNTAIEVNMPQPLLDVLNNNSNKESS